MKKILCIMGVIGGLGVSYKIGEIVGGIKVGIQALDIADEAFPGVKRAMTESISNKILDAIFGSKEHDTED